MKTDNPSNKTLTTKDIAQLAGVSVGTVDRVLHKRGQVALKTREKIESIIQEHGYKPNLTARNLVKNQSYTIAAIIPWSDPNDYWNGVDQGMQKAIEEFKSRNLRIQIENYSFTHPKSMLSALRTLSNQHLDGLILCPTTSDISHQVLEELRKVNPNLPYIYVDSLPSQTNPDAFFIQNANQSGYLAGRLIYNGISHLNEPRIVLLKDESSNPKVVQDRIHGFQDFFKENLRNARLELLLREDISRQLMDADGWDIHALFIPNSRAHRILDSIPAQTLKQKPKIVGFDLTPSNIDYLRFGLIDYLINQNPEAQAYMAVEAFYRKLVLGFPFKKENYMPLEIITQENLEHRCSNLFF